MDAAVASAIYTILAEIAKFDADTSRSDVRICADGRTVHVNMFVSNGYIAVIVNDAINVKVKTAYPWPGPAPSQHALVLATPEQIAAIEGHVNELFAPIVGKFKINPADLLTWKIKYFADRPQVFHFCFW